MNWNGKLNFEIRQFVAKGELTKEEKDQLILEMREDGYELEDISMSEDFEDNKLVYYHCYRFAKYYKD